MHPAAFVARYWPFANGSGRILDKFAKHVDLGEGERIGRTTDGFSLLVFADDLIGRHILLSGRFDRSVIQVLLDEAHPGDVLLDVGANIGYYSAVFLQHVREGTAICIEPQPGIFELLRENLAPFGDRAKPFQIGLAAEDGEMRFHINQSNRGASKFCEEGEIAITVREAKRVFRELSRVDLLKVDVEGFEGQIFRSISDELSRLKPRAILFEDQTGAAFPKGAIGTILTCTGYDVYGIEKSLLKTKLVRIEKRSDCRFNDYLALRR